MCYILFTHFSYSRIEFFQAHLNAESRLFQRREGLEQRLRGGKVRALEGTSTLAVTWPLGAIGVWGWGEAGGGAGSLITRAFECHAVEFRLPSWSPRGAEDRSQPRTGRMTARSSTLAFWIREHGTHEMQWNIFMKNSKRKLRAIQIPGAAHFPEYQDMTVMDTLRQVSTSVYI